MSGATCELWTRFERQWACEGGPERGYQLLVPMPLEQLLIGYTNYQGSSDIISPGLVGEDGDRWETGGWNALRDCNHPDPIPAWVYSWYAYGKHWPVHVCLSCRVVHGELCAYGPIDEGYTPLSEAEKRVAQQWRDEGWPKDGPPPGVAGFDER